jgi:hypothetical protein
MKRTIVYILLLAVSASLLSACSMEETGLLYAWKKGRFKPSYCQDTTLIRLQSMPLESLSQRDLELLKYKEALCEDYSARLHAAAMISESENASRIGITNSLGIITLILIGGTITAVAMSSK